MPLIAHSDLPTFSRLEQMGMTVLTPDRATKQDFRELHVGLLNMMPDAAIEATERQFFRLVGQSSQIAQFYIHPFTLKEIERGEKARLHIEKFYEDFEQIQDEGLDALIITGANVSQPDLTLEPFWEPLKKIVTVRIYPVMFIKYWLHLVVPVKGDGCPRKIEGKSFTIQYRFDSVGMGNLFVPHYAVDQSAHGN